MAITQSGFGALPDGRKVDLFTLDDGAGVVVKITNFGGIIVSMRTPDRDGKPGEIGVGFDTIEEYVRAHDYFGALVGRVGNRIADGRSELGGQQFLLYVDATGQHLHGGKDGFSAKLWNAEVVDNRLRLDYESPDGEENYPGNLKVSVWYSLSGRDLCIDYKAQTDRTTLVNLTNHVYFNLNGFKRDIMAHDLRIQADRYTPVNDKLIPTGEMIAVAGTPFDFTEAKPIGRDFAQVAGGYDHNFVFKESLPQLQEWLVEVRDPDSGRTLAMTTTEPCVQFYAGNFLNGSLTGLNGTTYKQHYGFCLEAQRPPDAIHHPSFVQYTLHPDDIYRQTTVYRFGTE